MIEKGVVKWFDNERGYGFINSGNQDYFVHFKSIESNGYKTLLEGQAVTFNPVKSQKGWTAQSVRIESGNDIQ